MLAKAVDKNVTEVITTGREIFQIVMADVGLPEISPEFNICVRT